jgi:hypothetical protein
MSKRLLVYVEGQTEEFFVNRVLKNHLLTHGVQVARPILAATSREPSGQRGGFVNWPAVEADLRTLFGQETDPNVRFTTLLDLYALPETVPGYVKSTTGQRSTAEVAAIEAALAKHFSEPRFVPYLQRHEFEALVLAHPPALKAIFPAYASSLVALEASLAGFSSAEDIDDGPNTHPSARLGQAIPMYGVLKASNSYFVVSEAGLQNIRPRCPRFDDWLQRWEAWGNTK